MLPLLRRFSTLAIGLLFLTSGAHRLAAQASPIPSDASAREGELTFGIYYGEAQQLSISAGIATPHLFGSDENLSLSFNASQYYTALSITVTDTDFFEGPFSRQFTLGIQTVKPHAGQVGEYAYSHSEAGISFGRPLSSNFAYSFGAGVARYSFDEQTRLPTYMSDYIAAVDESFTDYFIHASAEWNRSEQNDWLRSGTAIRLNGQTGVVSHHGYGKFSGRVDHFTPFMSRMELRSHASLHYGWSVGSDQPYPIFHNFTGGGPGTLRGFGEHTLGPASEVPDTSEMSYPGGEFAVFGGLEARTPLRARNDIYAMGYLDFGNVYANSDQFDMSSLRRSIGIGLQWETSAGPLSIFVSQPLSPKNNDHLSEVQFQFGMRF